MISRVHRHQSLFVARWKEGENGVNEDRDCNNCRWFDPRDGYCVEKAEYHHGYDDACEKWTKEKDTKR